MSNVDVLKAISEAPETGKAVLAFNRTNGEFVFALTNVTPDELSGQEHMVYVEAEFNPNTQVVQGTLGNYKIVDKSSLPQPIYEASIDAMMATKITKVYPVAEQVNVLGRALQILAKEHNIVLEELEEMLDYISLARDTNREQKEAYRNDPAYEFISNADIEARNEKLYEGGLHEALGPRTIEGGRVFH